MRLCFGMCRQSGRERDLVGVVVGLIALVAELDQSSRLAEVSAYQTRVSEIEQAQREIALSPDLAEIIAKYNAQGVESLTPAELIRIRNWNLAIIRRMQGQYYQWQQGFLDRQVIDQTLDLIANSSYETWEELGIAGGFPIPEWEEEIMARVTQ